MANYLPVMLAPSAMNWLTNLRTDSIGSWDDLKRVFIENYTATCVRPGTKHNLEKFYQRTGEPLRGYIRCFSEMRNSIPNINDGEVISAFIRGLYHHPKLRSKLNQKTPRTIGELLQIANPYADAKEADQHHKDDVTQTSRSERQPRCNDDRREERGDDDRDRRYNDRPEGSKARQFHHRRLDNAIALVEQPHAKRNYDDNYENLLDAKAYRDEENKTAKKRNAREDDSRKDPEHPKDANTAFQDPSKTVGTIFGGAAASKNKRKQKLTTRQVLSVSNNDTIADPRYLNWSEYPITFSRADQWSDIPCPGRFPLILDTIIQKVRFRKVIIDGGSALNILFAGALTELGLSKKDLTPVDSPF
ncbi:uncharacterized protein [Miscanthus floridulus]|uniref:uncharacterized protein n=1 Tax=Miscanthus floridulus TaxID=154761 RepID=UPI00345A5A7F